MKVEDLIGERIERLTMTNGGDTLKWGLIVIKTPTRTLRIEWHAGTVMSVSLAAGS